MAGGLLRRERLHRLLDGALDGPWVVLSAPAGCGKSSLLASWTAELPASVAVDAVTDGDLGSRLREETGRWAAEGSRRLLLIDHRDALSRTAWRRLAELVDADRSTTVAVATRVDPPLPMGRLAIAGELTEIRAKDLRWTEPEMRALLRHAGVDLDEKAVDLLRARTAGWSAGLRLAIAGMTRAEDPYEFLTRFGEDDHATIDYLAQEVFAALPERLRDLLAATSGTADLTAESAAAVSGQPDAGLMLDDLVDEGLLCTADDAQARRYAYHPLLLSLLRRGIRAPGRVARQRSAHWHAAHARPAAAVVDSSVSGEHELTARLILEHGAAARRRSGGVRRRRSPPSRPIGGTRTPNCSRSPAGPAAGRRPGRRRTSSPTPSACPRRLAGRARYDLLALRAWAAAAAGATRSGAWPTSSSSATCGSTRRGSSSRPTSPGSRPCSAGWGSCWPGTVTPGSPAWCWRRRDAPAGERTAGRVPGIGALAREARATQALLSATAGHSRTALAIAQEVIAAADDSALAEASTATARLAMGWAPRRGRGSPFRIACRAGRCRSGRSPRRSAGAGRRLQLHPAGRERGAHDTLGDRHHVLLVDERHLHVELRELELAVGPQRLVAEAAGDLVVALEAGDHQQLLEQLRRLRQRVEACPAACAPARRSRARPRASTASGSASRCRGTRPVQVVADRLRDAVAQLERALHRLAPQVEVAVAQAQRFVHGRVLVDRERRASRPRASTSSSVARTSISPVGMSGLTVSWGSRNDLARGPRSPIRSEARASARAHRAPPPG